MSLGGSFTHSSRIRLPATPNAALASALDPSRPLAELWEQLAIDDVIPHDWGQNPRRRFTQIVRMHLSELHPPTFEALRTFASLDPRAVLQAEALITEDACRNSYPPPGHVTWVFGDVLIYEDGFPDETELELYKLGFARPPRKPPWDPATLVCPVLIPSTTDTPPSS